MKKNGWIDPYMTCPAYESENFLLRFISLDDAEGLLECYRNPTPSVQANGAGASFGYGLRTPVEMRAFIERWLAAYKNRCFIRFCVIDKRTDKAIGTVEVYDYGVLPIDVTLDL